MPAQMLMQDGTQHTEGTHPHRRTPRRKEIYKDILQKQAKNKRAKLARSSMEHRAASQRQTCSSKNMTCAPKSTLWMIISPLMLSIINGAHKTPSPFRKQPYRYIGCHHLRPRLPPRCKLWRSCRLYPETYACVCSGSAQ